MQFNLAVFTVAIVSASAAMAAQVSGFVGADCTGTMTGVGTIGTGCETFGGRSFKSIKYSGVPNSIKFFKSGGQNDNCNGTPSATRGAGSGCVTAPDGVNWESVLIN
ncbi:hypothetical protein D9619_004851 [Psilocybe cf. subviscida]|uniref:Uncharacterized protein n=1 Tax=Psilocybe cf. subviscida TaxID=2480587 RepID=A0A8H5BRS5_9AGAR|nr:hypothetical protein D9619_004851 [Psilocybe cf. subviscida]